jgi:hypothetical protein
MGHQPHQMKVLLVEKPNLEIDNRYMTDVIADLFVDGHPSKAERTLFVDANCILIASTVSEHSFRQIMRRVLADGNINSIRNALYDCQSSRIDIAFYGL